MSLGIIIKGPEGLVLAADSRVTLQAKSETETLTVNFDNATKLLSFSKPHEYVGAVTYGAAVIGLRTAQSFIPELEEEILEEQKKRLEVEDYATLLSNFFGKQWQKTMPSDYPGPSMTFVVGGYGPTDSYGRVFLFSLPDQKDPVEQNKNDENNNVPNFGMTWGGQLQIASRIIHGFDPELRSILQKELGLDDAGWSRIQQALMRRLQFSIPYQVLPLQDCVNLATMMIRTTVEAQSLSVGVRGVGGPMDLAVVTRTEGLRYIQKKALRVNEGHIPREASYFPREAK
jgi:hypothetical protein